MKFAYIDESGDKDQGDVFVMAGMLIDAYKFRKCTFELDQKFRNLRALHPSSPQDFKTSKMINGISGWRRVEPETRKKFINDCIKLIITYGRIYAFAMSFNQFDNAIKQAQNLPENQCEYWVASSMYICALIQKKMQSEKNNKGLTVLIFDDNKMHMPKLSHGLYSCHEWYDDLYIQPKKPKTKKDRLVSSDVRFNQIINTAFAIKSEHSSLVQAADLISYVYRRNLELISGKKEAYEGEAMLYQDWSSQLNAKKEPLGRASKDSATLNFYKTVKINEWEL